MGGPTRWQREEKQRCEEPLEGQRGGRKRQRVGEDEDEEEQQRGGELPGEQRSLQKVEHGDAAAVPRPGVALTELPGQLWKGLLEAPGGQAVGAPEQPGAAAAAHGLGKRCAGHDGQGAQQQADEEAAEGMEVDREVAPPAPPQPLPPPLPPQGPPPPPPPREEPAPPPSGIGPRLRVAAGSVAAEGPVARLAAEQPPTPPRAGSGTPVAPPAAASQLATGGGGSPPKPAMAVSGDSDSLDLPPGFDGRL